MQIECISKDVKIRDNKLRRYISYEEWKSPIKTTKPMEFIIGGKISQQGEISGAYYELAVGNIGTLSPYNECTYGYKTEVLSTNECWPLFTKKTIDEIMKMEGVNPNLKIYIPDQNDPNARGKYVSYEQWKQM
jgi:hypothetical protein